MLTTHSPLQVGLNHHQRPTYFHVSGSSTDISSVPMLHLHLYFSANGCIAIFLPPILRQPQRQQKNYLDDSLSFKTKHSQVRELGFECMFWIGAWVKSNIQVSKYHDSCVFPIDHFSPLSSISWGFWPHSTRKLLVLTFSLSQVCFDLWHRPDLEFARVQEIKQALCSTW